MKLVDLRRMARTAFFVLLGVVLLVSSVVPPGDQTSRIRAYTRSIEFDYVSWTLNALGVKFNLFSLETANYLSTDRRRQMVLDYMELIDRIQRLENEINVIYANPAIDDPDQVSLDMRQRLKDLKQERDRLGPVVESVIQGQVSQVIGQMGLAVGGQPIPPVLYHSTPLPLALIVSPRNEIRQILDISLAPGMTVDEKDRLEETIRQELNYSVLVVPIGGIGVYPTMVQQTNNLNWLTEVVAHEWVHNYLTLRPLGINYYTTPQLRTMNETAASIAGKEIGLEVLKRFYPELVPPEPPKRPPLEVPEKKPEGPQPPAFDFRAEMRKTREHVEELLAQDKVEEAEEYMERRRNFFWENGYQIRKLNQAYFAFYGAYADLPGGAAGVDPVGAAVRDLRAQSPRLADFLNRISWMWSFEQLQDAVGGASS